MAVESRPGTFSGMSDDRLGTVAVSVVVAELQWTPDVTPAVMDRISRDAVAYPEHFDRRPLNPGPVAPPPPARSAKRTIGRLVVFAIVLFIIAALVAFAATVSAAADTSASLPSILNLAPEVV